MVDDAHDALCVGQGGVVVGMVAFAQGAISGADGLRAGIPRHLQIIVVSVQAFGHTLPERANKIFSDRHYTVRPLSCMR